MALARGGGRGRAVLGGAGRRGVSQGELRGAGAGDRPGGERADDRQDAGWQRAAGGVAGPGGDAADGREGRAGARSKSVVDERPVVSFGRRRGADGASSSIPAANPLARVSGRGAWGGSMSPGRPWRSWGPRTRTRTASSRSALRPGRRGRFGSVRRQSDRTTVLEGVEARVKVVATIRPDRAAPQRGRGGAQGARAFWLIRRWEAGDAAGAPTRRGGTQHRQRPARTKDVARTYRYRFTGTTARQVHVPGPGAGGLGSPRAR